MLSALLVASAVSLVLGGLLLFVYNLVPFYLIALTAFAAVILAVLAVFVIRRNKIAINVATLLGIVAPAFSLSTPAHVSILLSLGASPLVTALGLLQLFGFFVFPIAYVILRIVYRNNLR